MLVHIEMKIHWEENCCNENNIYINCLFGLVGCCQIGMKIVPTCGVRTVCNCILCVSWARNLQITTRKPFLWNRNDRSTIPFHTHKIIQFVLHVDTRIWCEIHIYFFNCSARRCRLKPGQMKSSDENGNPYTRHKIQRHRRCRTSDCK